MSEDYITWVHDIAVIKKENLEDIIEQAFMAGQNDCGVDPSYSSAKEYCNKLMCDI